MDSLHFSDTFELLSPIFFPFIQNFFQNCLKKLSGAITEIGLRNLITSKEPRGKKISRYVLMLTKPGGLFHSK